MDKIKLLPHNQEMVEQIEKAMVNGYRKIFYTEATGLGKSYIFMYLVNKYFKDKKVLYITPKYHIWYNLQEYKEFEYIKDCVTMKCNADFNKLKDTHIGYDIIFIDEAHHLSTDIQGKNIIGLADVMLATNPNAYMFGFTATPYINGEFIGDMYFEKSIIGMDLFDAIDKGILQKIHYAVVVKEDIFLNNKEEYLSLKYNVETTSNMITDIINQYSHVKHWLAYFPYITELEENIEYFKKYFPDYKLFIIHSEIENSENILHEFEEYDGKAILASVSMILEGIHPKSVEGILLYRNVCTSNTFFQIIGRLGIMKLDVKPICIDIYSSYNNLIKNNMIINDIDADRDHANKSSIKKYIYMTPSTYQFLELSKVLYNLRYNNIQEYRGIRWSNDMELSKKLGKSSSYVSQNIYNGKSREELIDRFLDDKPIVYEYRGISWETDAELSEKLGKAKEYVSKRRYVGKTREELIDKFLDDKPIVHEYRGITWSSDSELSIKLGKNNSYVTQNIRLHRATREELIDRFLDDKPIVYEYRDITWSSIKDLAIKLNISTSYIRLMLRNGSTYNEIIDYIKDNRPYKYHEYRGITWYSDSELSRKLGKTDVNYVGRLVRKKHKTREELIDAFLENNEI